MNEQNGEKKEKIVILATHGPEDPERATLPFTIANGALVLEVEVTIVLQGSGVMLAKKGCYEHVYASHMPPLKDLMKSFLEQGGHLLVCTPCMEERRITTDMLVDAAKPVKAARAVTEILEATSTICY